MQTWCGTLNEIGSSNSSTMGWIVFCFPLYPQGNPFESGNGNGKVNGNDDVNVNFNGGGNGNGNGVMVSTVCTDNRVLAENLVWLGFV